MYAHQPPSTFPTLSTMNEPSAQPRACRIQALSILPAMSAAAPTMNGIDVETRPVRRNGGWMSMPGSTSSGFRPWPSGGVTGLSRNGEAKNAAAMRNAAMTDPAVATACGPPHGILGTVMKVNAAIQTDIIHVQKSSDPGCPLQSDAHFMCVCMLLDDTFATCAMEKSSVISAYARRPIARVFNPATA